MSKPTESECYKFDWDSLTPEQEKLYKLALTAAKSTWQRKLVLEMLSKDGSVMPLRPLAEDSNFSNHKKHFEN
jgi:hypothetical protein